MGDYKKWRKTKRHPPFYIDLEVELLGMKPGFYIILHVAYLPLTGENIKLDWPIRATRAKERNTKWGSAGHLKKKITNIGKD